ncbi:hypothetical protein [Bacillus smithii]|uniref:hypothetical protein n=1 Tax=Bacillus smithii TaxID=1479 RepID=UPI003D1E6995
MLQTLLKTITVNGTTYRLYAKRVYGDILVEIRDVEDTVYGRKLIADNDNFLSNLDQLIRSTERRRRAKQIKIDNLQVLKDLDCFDLRFE